MNFSNYKIYIADDGCAGHLIAPNEDHHLLDEKFMVPFDSGIKKLQEEKRAIWLTDNLSNKEMSDYFKKEFGIFAV